MVGGSYGYTVGTSYWLSLRNKKASESLNTLNKYKNQNKLNSIATEVDKYIKNNKEKIEKQYNTRKDK